MILLINASLVLARVHIMNVSHLVIVTFAFMGQKPKSVLEGLQRSLRLTWQQPRPIDSIDSLNPRVAAARAVLIAAIKVTPISNWTRAGGTHRQFQTILKGDLTFF